MTLQVQILSPAKVVARTDATHVLAPGVLGYMGILPGHAPLVSELGVGELMLEGGEGGKQFFFISGGYIDVAHDKVTILADNVEKVGEIDVARAEKSRKRALERLERKAADVDSARAQASLERANKRIASATRKTH